MKKNFIVCLILIGALWLSSCDNFLEKEPQAILGNTSFYKTESDALMAVNAVYDKINKRYTSNRSMWILNDIPTPDTETPSAEAPIAIINNFTFGATSEDIDNFWIQCYDAISRANLAIQKIPEIDMDESVRSRLVGEVKFLRGWFYMLLVTTYGQVPLVLEPISASDKEALTQDKASFEEIYNAIQNDFADAESSLPWTYDGSNVGRATKGAAKSYLAKVYLFREMWQEAATKAGEVITEAESNGTYMLLPSFRAATWNKNSKESIFELQSIAGTGGWEDGNEGNTITVWNRPGCLDGWGLHFGTQDLADAFEPGDPRKKYTLLSPGESYGNQVFPTGCLQSNQYPLLKLMGDPALGTGGDADAEQNYVFMRLAEVYLMKAEAEAESNNITSAEEALEKVRSRARNDASAAPGSVPVISGLSQTDLIEAIRHERRVELATEMKRFPDLRRWGIADEVNQADGKAFVAGKHEYFPIPQAQIDLSEGNLKQNNGY